jgi:hypothetical protein
VKPAARRGVYSAMRNLVVGACLTMLVACGALAWGWMRMAETAATATRQCELRRNRRLAAVPDIVLANGQIKYRGDVIATFSESVNESPTFKIDALFERLRKDLKSTCDSDEICLDSLVTLNVPFGTPEVLIAKIVNTVWAAGYDVVHVPDRDADRW